MPSIVHINCGTLLVPNFPTVVCHCLALLDGPHTVLVDTGIGLLDIADPTGRLGEELVHAAGFQFDARDTAVRRLEAMGVARESVRDIILTHADPDHAGGLADFPHARVHLSAEEHRQIDAGHPRYTARHFDHNPLWRPYSQSSRDWFGLPARRVDLPISSEVLLVPLVGHTHGHCGVAIESNGRWLLHVGDAYYLRAELTDPQHPVSALAAARADDNTARLDSLHQLRRIASDHADAVTMFGYHDLTELPRECIDWE